MLAVKQYRRENYPPGGNFVQFGDAIFASHVKAAGQGAQTQTRAEVRRQENAPFHMDRLERLGLTPHRRTEEFSIETPRRDDSDAWMDPASQTSSIPVSPQSSRMSSPRVSRAPSEYFADDEGETQQQTSLLFGPSAAASSSAQASSSASGSG